MKLSAIKVSSFLTRIEVEESNTAKGGTFYFPILPVTVICPVGTVGPYCFKGNG